MTATRTAAQPAARFDLDEPLFRADDALPGLLTAEEMDALLGEWGAAKMDEWCAVSAVTNAAAAVRNAIGAPADAPIAAVLAVADSGDHARRPRVRRALAAYADAATLYEGARTALALIRARAFTA